nr:MFS transporter [Nakamurella lactea]
MTAPISPAPGSRTRWLLLAVVGLAQLMVVLDVTVVNIALPSAQRALGFTSADRQWVITAYALAFGSLLLLGGRLADLVGSRITFIVGLAGFAAASAVGGAANGFGMLVAARACQGAFAAVMAPSALSILTTTFSDPRERGKAFGVFGAIAGSGGAIGMLLGGVMTEYLSWRWTLYVNLVFAGLALVGATALLRRQPVVGRRRLDLPGALAVSGAMFCLVYGFSNAALHSWHSPSTYGFLVAGVVLLAVFVLRQLRAAAPLLPPRVVLDRNRGGAYLAMFIAGAGMFGTFLFVTYYLQNTLGFSPVAAGLAFLPMVVVLMLAAAVSQVVLMPRSGPRPLIGGGMLLVAAGMVWMTQISVHSGYASMILPPMILIAIGFGLVFSPALNTGTFGTAASDTGVASATINVAQQLGGSIGTALLNTVAAAATTGYLTAHLNGGAAPGGRPDTGLVQESLVRGYTVGFWWTAGIFAVGAVVCFGLLRSGPLQNPVATNASERQPQSGPELSRA